MLKNLSMKMKLALFPALFIVLIIVLGIVFSYYKSSALLRNSISIETDKSVQQLLKGRISVYQFLRNPNIDTAQKVRNDFAILSKGVLQIKSTLSIEENKKIADSIIQLSDSYIKDFDKFANMRIKDFQNSILEESPEIKSIIANMVKTGLTLESELDKINLSAAQLRDSSFSSLNFNMLIVSIIASMIFIILSMFISKNTILSLNSIQSGLQSFFSFLNRETTKATLINLDSKDEFGQMAVVINQNIEKVKKGIDEDRRLIDETITVLGEFEQGDLCQRLELSVSNPALMQLKTVLNNMASNLENNIDNVLKVIEEYSHYNYLNKVDEKGLKEHILKLATGVNTLGNAVTNMLSTSLQNGLELQSEAGTLKQAVESLSTASNQQAASLEETAAAMEEMTSNVQNNVAKSNEMAQMATQTDSAARDGAVLAQRTASAMTEIQSSTNSINDAVAIIENIAFQTNILSLNAAVEAATAGDAGKGFAVVAQEVRNLANRSADAAKEIKAMAALAANKSNEGMNIATELTRGFEVIADKIAQTASMVQDVSNANREQMQGIGQINTAVTQLDQMTQENAKVAAQADSIANATIQKAQAMVEDALSKEFVGKNNIRTTQTSQRTSKPVQAAKPVVVSKGKYASNAIAKNSSKHDGDVWESF